MSVEVWMIELTTFVVVCALVVLAFSFFTRPEKRTRRRLESLLTKHATATGTASKWKLLRLPEFVAPEWVAQLLPQNLERRSRLRARLHHAGIYQVKALTLYFMIQQVCMLLPIVIVAACYTSNLLNWQMAVLWGALLAGAGHLLPGMVLDRLKTRRQTILVRSLPDFLDLLVVCVEGGLALDGALRRVTQELSFAHRVLASEMDRVQQEIELGSTSDAALKSFADRSDMEDIRTLGVFVQQARRFGTSLGDALRTHSEMLRTRREQRAEEMAQKAAVKILFPTILLIFPSVFVVLAGPAVIQLSNNLLH